MIFRITYIPAILFNIKTWLRESEFWMLKTDLSRTEADPDPNQRGGRGGAAGGAETISGVGAEGAETISGGAGHI